MNTPSSRRQSLGVAASFARNSFSFIRFDVRQLTDWTGNWSEVLGPLDFGSWPEGREIIAHAGAAYPSPRLLAVTVRLAGEVPISVAQSALADALNLAGLEQIIAAPCCQFFATGYESLSGQSMIIVPSGWFSMKILPPMTSCPGH